MITRLVFAFWVTVAAATHARAAEFIVRTDGGGTHTTIQSAIDASASGDLIVVHPDVYQETLDFLGKNVHIRSISPTDAGVRDATIINANQMDTVVTFDSGESAGAILEGFTIRRGRSETNGGGVLCLNGANPTIRLNRIVACFTFGSGAGIYVGAGCAPRIERNIVFGNRCDARGAGIYVTAASPVIRHNVIENNEAGCSAGGGVYVAPGSHATVFSNNTVSRNFARLGGGIAVSGSDMKIDRNRIIGNYSIPRGGGISLSSSDVVLCSNVIAGNRAEIAAALDVTVSDVAIRRNTFVGNWATDDAALLFIGGSQIELVGNVIASTRAGTAIQSLAASDVQADYNDWFANVDGDFGGAVTLNVGNVFIDPELVTTGSWRFSGIFEDVDEEPPCNEEARREYVATYFGPGATLAFAHYRIRPGRERFDVGLTGFPAGQHAISINGVIVGQIFVGGGGNGNLEFDTNDGNFPPGFPDVFGGDAASFGQIASEPFGHAIMGTGEVWRPGDEHLRNDSSLIDIGPPTLPPNEAADLDGQPRMFGDATDIGADEFLPPGNGDADGDGDVDFADAWLLQRCSAASEVGLVDPQCATVDLDGDADVDSQDWAMWQSAFTGPQ